MKRCKKKKKVISFLYFLEKKNEGRIMFQEKLNFKMSPIKVLKINTGILILKKYSK